MKTNQRRGVGTAKLAQLRTRLEEAEASLRRQQDLVELITETTPAGIIRFDRDGRIVSANSRAERLLGLTRDQLVGLTYDDLQWRVTDDDGELIPDEQLPFRQVLRTGEAVRKARLAVQWPDGRRVILSVHAAPIADEQGRVTAVLAMFDDVTERLTSQQKLEASERRYRSLFNSMQDAFSLQEIIHDDDGKACDYRFLEVNPGFEKLTGIPAGDWIGRTVKELLPGTEPHWIELCGEVARTGEPVRVEYYAQEFDRHYEVLAYRPAPNQCAALSTDVTERKRAEESLLQRSRLDATATLAGGVAHDLNNLMVGVVGNADMLRRNLADDRGAVALLDQIVEAGQQAGRMAKQLLSFARPTMPHTEIVDPADLIEETLRIQQGAIPARITVERECTRATWRLRADPSQVVQVLMNLCINAAESIEGNGRVRVEARNVRLPEEAADPHPAVEPGRYVVLSVQDDGAGMEPSVRARIFEAFFSTKREGRGLGLAAVHGIVKSHGGDIVVRSEPGKGTTFDVYLPATDEATVQDEGDADAGLRGSETVLLIDDEPTIRRIVSTLLETLGYTVLAADSGKTAVEIARDHDGAIHAAILDLGMPVMSGKETFPLLRRARPEMKILICSGYDRQGDAAALLAAGAAGFVSKPFLVEDLIPPLRAALEG